MKDKYKIIIFTGGMDYYDVVCHDLQSDPDCIVMNTLPWKECKFSIVRLLRKIHLSLRIHRYIHLPFRKIWYSDLPDVDHDVKVIAVFYQMYPWYHGDLDFRNFIKKKYKNLKTVFVLVNPLAKSPDLPNVDSFKNAYDLILSDDKRDCLVHGFQYWEDNYSKLTIPAETHVSSDVFFVGAAKDRLSFLHQIFIFLKNNGFSPLFYITGVAKKDMLYKEIHYNEYLPYADVLKRVVGCNVLLEVTQSEQEGLTLRTQEALTYEKKLLTNNSFITKKAYYNETNVCFFAATKDIDLNWVKDIRPVFYDNKPDFSAQMLKVFLVQHFTNQQRGVL